MTQEIRLTYFFLPLTVWVQPNRVDEHVVVQRTVFGWTYEFIRLPVPVARQFADFLDLAADNADANPLVSGMVGEVHGDSVRKLGRAQMRVRISVKRHSTIQFAVRQLLQGLGKKTQYQTPKISSDEARRFASLVREASA